jgi:cytochrome P450
MSFAFKTRAFWWRTIAGMKPVPAECPHRPTPPVQAPGAWPPGPPSGITGWGLLRRMSRDLLGTLEQWQRQYGDLVHLKIWPEHTLVVTAPALVRQLLVDHHDDLIRWEHAIAIFSGLHGTSVLTAEGDAWKIKRQALQPLFSPKGVQPLIPLITAAAADAMALWGDGGARFPIEPAFNALGMGLILRMLFTDASGADSALAGRAVHDTAVAANAAMYWPVSLPDWMPWKRRARQGRRVLKGLIERHIGARLALDRAAWPADMLSRLLALHHVDPANWPLKAVHDECMTTFLAGHETGAATLTWWAWCMAANPALQGALQGEVDGVLQGRAPGAEDVPRLRLLHQSLLETMRLYPAAPVLLSRRSTRAITLGGWQLPAGTMFMIPPRLMHHDPRWFAEPHAFTPERFGDTAAAPPRGAFMPLGSGPRVCLGQHLAMAQMTLVAAMLLQRFTLALADGMAPPTPVFHITLRPAEPLCLALAPR